MSEDDLRQHLVGAFKNRAILYFLFFDEMREAFGAEKAEEVMKRAIYRRGEQLGRRFESLAPKDFAGLRDAFLSWLPDEGAMFAPTVERCDADGLDIRMRRCPLKEAWRETGVSEADIATLTRIAGTIDNGTFEGAGFSFDAETWRPGREGCCHLKIRAGKA